MNQEYKEYFQFLNELRASGDTNMFGASPYLQAEFGLDRREARRVLSDWMGWMQDREVARMENEVEAYYNR
jgi:hypothetical protein